MSNPDKYHGVGGTYVKVNGVRMTRAEADAAKAAPKAAEPAVETAPKAKAAWTAPSFKR